MKPLYGYRRGRLRCLPGLSEGGARAVRRGAAPANVIKTGAQPAVLRIFKLSIVPVSDESGFYYFIITIQRSNLDSELEKIKSGASSSAIFNSDHHHPAIIFKLKSITNVSSFKFYCQGVKSKCLSRAAF